MEGRSAVPIVARRDEQSFVKQMYATVGGRARGVDGLRGVAIGGLYCSGTRSICIVECVLCWSEQLSDQRGAEYLTESLSTRLTAQSVLVVCSWLERSATYRGVQYGT